MVPFLAYSDHHVYYSLDRESFLQLCREKLKLDDIEVVAVTRLHANSNSGATEKEKTKPLRIKLKTEQTRTPVLSKAKMLAKSENETFKYIYLKRDSTPMIRAEMKGSKENPKKERGSPTAKSAHQQSVNSSSHANAVNSVHSSMIYMCFNVDSLLNKRNELNMMIGEENPFVFRVTEVEPKNCKPQTQEAELGFETYKCLKKSEMHTRITRSHIMQRSG